MGAQHFDEYQCVLSQNGESETERIVCVVYSVQYIVFRIQHIVAYMIYSRQYTVYGML